MFQKGQSGNPSGRPALPKELKERLSSETPHVLDFWIDSYRNPELKWDFRNKAAENIVAYAYGKPKELVDMDITSRSDVTVMAHEEKIELLKKYIADGIIDAP